MRNRAPLLALKRALTMEYMVVVDREIALVALPSRGCRSVAGKRVVAVVAAAASSPVVRGTAASGFVVDKEPVAADTDSAAADTAAPTGTARCTEFEVAVDTAAARGKAANTVVAAAAEGRPGAAKSIGPVDRSGLEPAADIGVPERVRVEPEPPTGQLLQALNLRPYLFRPTCKPYRKPDRDRCGGRSTIADFPAHLRTLTRPFR